VFGVSERKEEIIKGSWMRGLIVAGMLIGISALPAWSGVPTFDSGPTQLGAHWFGTVDDLYLWSSDGVQWDVAQIVDDAGVNRLFFQDGGVNNYYRQEDVDRVLADCPHDGDGHTDDGTDGHTDDGTDGHDTSDGDASDQSSPSPRPRPTVPAGPTPEQVYLNWVMANQLAYVQTAELSRARRSYTLISATEMAEYNRRMDQDRCFPRCTFYEPPAEGLRGWRYALTPEAWYGESRLELPGMDGAQTTVRMRGVGLNAVWLREAWTVTAAAGYEQVSAGGIFEPLDHEVGEVRLMPMYRVARQDTSAVDVDLIGALSLSRVRYDEELPGIARDTSYLAPGAGLALGRWVDTFGLLRAVYLYQPSYALGSDRRQLTGDREIEVHSAGLAYLRPMYSDGQGAWWSSVQGVYQYTPGLPPGWDEDTITVSGSLDYRQEKWGVSLIGEHTLEDDLQGKNWIARVLLHWNL
jgi:hypothetical protein